MAIAYALTIPAAVALSASTAKTVLLAIAPAGHGLEVVELGISFDGVSSSAVPALVEVVQSTQATAGTSAGSPTITQVRGRSSGGSAPTGGYGYTAEPTVLTAIRSLLVPQFMGTFVLQLPLGRELETDSSGGTIKAIGLRITASATVNCRGYMEVEAVG